MDFHLYISEFWKGYIACFVATTFLYPIISIVRDIVFSWWADKQEREARRKRLEDIPE